MKRNRVVGMVPNECTDADKTAFRISRSLTGLPELVQKQELFKKKLFYANVLQMLKLA